MDPDRLRARYDRMTRRSLPKQFMHDNRLLYASAAPVLAELKFSEWGRENGYERTLVGSCSDFPPTGEPEQGSIIILDDRRLRVLNTRRDGAEAGVLIDLGAEFHAT